MSPKISIVTPTYNRVGFLRETVESVLSQTYKNIEYIIVNDGSVDETESYLDTLGSRVKVINKVNTGQVDSLNVGWGQASGDYISYLSDDDVLYPTAIECLMEALLRDPALVCVYPNADLIDSKGQLLKSGIAKQTVYEDLVIKQECYIGPGAIFSRSDYEEVGKWSNKLKLAPDREFWMRLGLKGDFKLVPSILAGYRHHEDSISVKDYKVDLMLEYVDVMDYYFKNFDPPIKIVDSKLEAYANAYLRVSSACINELRFVDAIKYLLLARDFSPKVISLSNLYFLVRTGFSRHIKRIFSRE